MLLAEMSRARADSLLEAIQEKHPQLHTHYEVVKYKNNSPTKQKQSSSAYLCSALRASLRDVTEMLARY